MKSKIRFGIIGCSSIAKKSAIPSIINGKNSTLEMIGSRTVQKSKKFAKEFSCSNFGTYDDVLKNDNVDAVYISLPISLHEKLAIKAAKHGKHVLCEKSISLSYNSARKIIKECKKNNVRIMENFTFQLHPQHKKILELIKKNIIGDIQTLSAKYGFTLPFSKKNFRFNKEFGGGSLNDIGCYLISVSMFVFRDVPKFVFCNLNTDKKSGVDISGNILLTFRNNKTGLLSFGYENYFQSTYDIWGKKGMIKCERAFNVTNKMKSRLSIHQNDKVRQIVIPEANQFQLKIENFCSVIQKNSNTNNFEKELLNQALIMDAARTSNIKNLVIKIKN
jgi:predicted dehydrogenase